MLVMQSETASDISTPTNTNDVPLIPLHHRRIGSTIRSNTYPESSIAGSSSSQHAFLQASTSAFAHSEHSIARAPYIPPPRPTQDLPDELKIEDWLTMCAPPEVKVGKEREGRSWKISRGRFDVLWRQYREDDLRVEKMESVLRFSVASLKQVYDGLYSVSEGYDTIKDDSESVAPSLVNPDIIAPESIDHFTRMCSAGEILEKKITQLREDLIPARIKRHRSFTKVKHLLLGPHILQRGRFGFPTLRTNGYLDGPYFKGVQEKAEADYKVLIQSEKKRTSEHARQTAFYGAIAAAVGLLLTYPTLFSARRGTLDLMALASIFFTITLVLCILFHAANFDDLSALREPLKRLIWLCLFFGVILLGFPLSTLDDSVHSTNTLNNAIFIIVTVIVSLAPMVPLSTSGRTGRTRKQYLMAYQLIWAGAFVLVLKGLSPKLTGISH